MGRLPGIRFLTDQRKLLTARQRLDLQFAAQCVSLGTDIFGVNQTHRTAGRGIRAAFSFIVNGNATLKVIRDPRIQRIVPAADNVAVIRFQFFGFRRKRPPKKVWAITSEADILIAGAVLLAETLAFL